MVRFLWKLVFIQYLNSEAMLIFLIDHQNPVFLQQRLGRFKKPFTNLKLRTMKNGESTRLGKLLRKTGIDELPQLWNVLIGDMSLVGPRPALPAEVDQYYLEDRQRLEAIPGITCIWQVSGRSNIPFPQQVQLDLQYIQSQSIWLDIKLLLQTIPAVLLSRGAY